MSAANPQEELKQKAAFKAVEHVRSGMVLGLGTGSTTAYAVARIGELWRSGDLSELVGIPTSERTAEQARSYGIPLSDLGKHPRIDLAIDGADEVDPKLDLIKGLGGALLREKQVELVAESFIVIVDESKLVETLGTLAPLPVEVSVETWRDQLPWLSTLGCKPAVRGSETEPFVSDNGNYIIDCRFSDGIEDPITLAGDLEARPGVLAHGLFLSMATEVIVARSSGMRTLHR